MFHARIRQLRAETLVLTDRHCKRDVRIFGFMAREDSGLELVAKHWCDRPHVRRRCEGGYFVVEVTEESDLELEGRASAPSCRIQSSHSISDHSGNRGPRATATAAKWCIPSTSPLLDSRRPSFPSGDVRMDQGQSIQVQSEPGGTSAEERRLPRRHQEGRTHRSGERSTAGSGRPSLDHMVRRPGVSEDFMVERDQPVDQGRSSL